MMSDCLTLDKLEVSGIARHILEQIWCPGTWRIFRGIQEHLPKWPIWLTTLKIMCNDLVFQYLKVWGVARYVRIRLKAGLLVPGIWRNSDCGAPPEVTKTVVNTWNKVRFCFAKSWSLRCHKIGFETHPNWASWARQPRGTRFLRHLQE